MLAWLAWPLVLFSPTLKKKKKKHARGKIKIKKNIPDSLCPSAWAPVAETHRAGSNYTLKQNCPVDCGHVSEKEMAFIISH